ncbi:GNAT family N-acetyltransferase [Humisphaera borealis]|uniref:GNAT family N-acetyltransferase n=1 Tax=Humisphaera borealis TaxID=2807512 RepID=A0A7M2WSV2_9BACT|nr:GNAT family N-acetyltransferase [Humisphaera borealis]QOV88499.1 GNAT family N-acetyltransferase [Humisphaera borealis]
MTTEPPDLSAIIVRRATPQEIIDLRWRILRQGLPRSEAIFPGDELATSLHFAAAAGDTVLCCATMHLNQWESEPAYQLRGMATDDGYRGCGLGSRVLEALQSAVFAETPIRLLWCNARTPALSFYRRQGWEVRSDMFHIPTAGPHVKMTRRLT